MSKQLSIVITNKHNYLTDTPEEKTFTGYKYQGELSNQILHNCVAATLLNDLSIVTIPDRDKIIEQLTDPQQVIYSTYVIMAKQAKKLALNRATVEELNLLISSLGK